MMQMLNLTIEDMRLMEQKRDLGVEDILKHEFRKVR